jgi:hypothetical protein
MTSILKVSTIQNTAGGAPTAADLGLNVAGSVLQVVRTGWSNYATTSSTSLVNTGRSATITPTSVNSKVLILLTFGYYAANGVSDYLISTFFRNGTDIGQGSYPCMMLNRLGNTDSNYTQAVTGSLYDSPATTSTVVYDWYVRTSGGSSITYGDARMANSITLIEIAG